MPRSISFQKAESSSTKIQWKLAIRERIEKNNLSLRAWGSSRSRSWQFGQWHLTCQENKNTKNPPTRYISSPKYWVSYGMKYASIHSLRFYQCWQLFAKFPCVFVSLETAAMVLSLWFTKKLPQNRSSRQEFNQNLVHWNANGKDH